MKTLFPVSLLILLLFGGCATQYNVRLDGLAENGGAALTGKSYALVSETPGVKDTDLFFKEVAYHLDVVLKKSGYRPVDPGGEADIVIGVNAYLSEPMVETQSYSEPVYARGYGRSYSIQVPVVNKNGKVVRYVSRYYSTGPTYHYAGSVERDRQYTVFDKILELSAHRQGEQEEIWNLKISLRDESSDYRMTLPYMLVAAQPYIGKRTNGEEIVAIRQDSPEVASFIDRLRYE